nr:hypothetical protein Q903MT_gene6203 [Picea sitchensis]
MAARWSSGFVPHPLRAFPLPPTSGFVPSPDGRADSYLIPSGPSSFCRVPPGPRMRKFLKSVVNETCNLSRS